jgi:phospholipase/carboxylesterase
MKLIFLSLILIVMTAIQPKYAYLKGDTMLLHYLVREPKVKTENPPLLLLLHGVGSNENDLFSFANQLPDQFLVVSARAPFSIAEGSYKWYEVDFSTGKPVIDAQQAEKSRNILLQFINQLAEKHRIDTQQVYLGGFSQGAIMSYSVGLTRPDKVKGIIALSGRVLEQIKPNMAEMAQFKNFKALIIHGKNDNVLPLQYAKEAKVLLEKQQIATTFHELDMGHTISKKTIELVVDWLK